MTANLLTFVKESPGLSVVCVPSTLTAAVLIFLNFLTWSLCYHYKVEFIIQNEVKKI